MVMRIAHLTDLHLRHYLPGTSASRGRMSRLMPAVLARAVACLKDLRPDLGVVSGDLVDVPGDHAADPRFRTLVWHDLRLVRDILSRSAMPWIVIDGNHDLPEQVDRVFETPAEFRIKGYRVLTFRDGEGAQHVPHREGLQEERFAQALTGAEDTLQIHVQHYVIQPRRDEGYPHTYLHGEAMAERIVASGRVRLVLSGHYHRGIAPFRVADTWFAVAPALCVAPFPMMIYDLDGRNLTWQRITLEDTG
jgi:predicted MPP superfamily phosphohydrolase